MSMLAGHDKQKGKKIIYSLVWLLHDNIAKKKEKKAENLLKIKLPQCNVAFKPLISPSFKKNYLKQKSSISL